MDALTGFIVPVALFLLALVLVITSLFLAKRRDMLVTSSVMVTTFTLFLLALGVL
jgi:hypothetical protein